MSKFRKPLAALSLAFSAALAWSPAALANPDADHLFGLFNEICLRSPLQVEKSVAKLRSFEGVNLEGLGEPIEGDAFVLFKDRKRGYEGVIREYKSLELCSVRIKLKAGIEAALAASLEKIQSLRGVTGNAERQPNGVYKFKYKNNYILVDDNKQRVHMVLINQ